MFNFLWIVYKYNKTLGRKLVEKIVLAKRKRPSKLFKCQISTSSGKEYKTKYRTITDLRMCSGPATQKLCGHMSDITQYKGSDRSINNNDPDLPDQLNEFYPCLTEITKQSLSVQWTRLRPHLTLRKIAI